MSVEWSMLTLFLAALMLADDPAMVNAPSPAPAVIEQSASTNTAGFTVSVERTGLATVRSAPSTPTIRLPNELATQLFTDLDRAGALGELLAGHCLKSMSFGTTTVVVYGGQRSPDLQCAQDAPERALYDDVRAISQFVMHGMALPRNARAPRFAAAASPG